MTGSIQAIASGFDGVMSVLPDGMAMDLTRFRGESAQELTALHTLDELDQYTYYVAGCVGEFWTRMVCAHRPAMARWDVTRMSAMGVRFGKGLQLTNIVKDIARSPPWPLLCAGTAPSRGRAHTVGLAQSKQSAEV